MLGSSEEDIVIVPENTTPVLPFVPGIFSELHDIDAERADAAALQIRLQPFVNRQRRSRFAQTSVYDCLCETRFWVVFWTKHRSKFEPLFWLHDNVSIVHLQINHAFDTSTHIFTKVCSRYFELVTKEFKPISSHLDVLGPVILNSLCCTFLSKRLHALQRLGETIVHCVCHGMDARRTARLSTRWCQGTLKFRWVRLPKRLIMQRCFLHSFVPDLRRPMNSDCVPPPPPPQTHQPECSTRTVPPAL